MVEEIVGHLNECHPDVLGLLAHEPLGSVRAVSVDPDGLLLDTGRRLTHVAFPSVVQSPDDALEAIAQLLRAVPSVRLRVRAGRARATGVP